jgi:uncharacterized protein (DUF2164 family)
MAIELDDEVRKQLLVSLRRFFEEELDQEIGDLKAELVMQYLLEELGPVVYNKAVSDAQRWLQLRVDDLEGSCYEPELLYWQKRG